MLVFVLFCGAAAHADTFTFSRSFRVGPNPRAIVAADLNENGWPEIITADTGPLGDLREERPANDELSLLLAQGDLEYVKHHPSLKTGFAPYAIAVANIDAIKLPDIVVASFLAVRHRDLCLHRNLPEGIFESLQYRVPDDGLDYHRHVDGDGLPVFTQPGLTDLAIHDLDKDGYRDVVATGWASDVLVIFPGQAETYFGDPVFIPAPGGPRALRIHDFDGDGRADVAAVMYSSGEVALWRGTSDGWLDPVQRFPTRGRLPTTITVADINNDGIMDLVVSHAHSDDSITIFYGEGGFSFPVSQEILLGENRNVVEHEIRDVAAADFTGNGRTDLAVACFASSQVVLLANMGDDTSPAQPFRTERYRFRDGRPRALAVADFNQNGKPDLAVAQWEPDAVQLLLNR